MILIFSEPIWNSCNYHFVLDLFSLTKFSSVDWALEYSGLNFDVWVKLEGIHVDREFRGVGSATKCKQAKVSTFDFRKVPDFPSKNLTIHFDQNSIWNPLVPHFLLSFSNWENLFLLRRSCLAEPEGPNAFAPTQQTVSSAANVNKRQISKLTRIGKCFQEMVCILKLNWTWSNRKMTRQFFPHEPWLIAKSGVCTMWATAANLVQSSFRL